MLRTRSGGRVGGFRQRRSLPGGRPKAERRRSGDGDKPNLDFELEYSKPKDYLQRLPLPKWTGGATLLYTPYEPVEPWDCDRWPSSPYCGGNPFAYGDDFFGVSLAVNSCEAVIVVTPQLGVGKFRIKGPPYEIGVRSGVAACNKPPPPPTPYPGPSREWWPSPGGSKAGCLYLVQLTMRQNVCGFGEAWALGPEVVAWGPLYGITGSFRDSAEVYPHLPQCAGFLSLETFKPYGLVCHGSISFGAIQFLSRQPGPVVARPHPVSTIAGDEGQVWFASRNFRFEWRIQELTEQIYLDRMASSPTLAESNFWNQQRLFFKTFDLSRCYEPKWGPPRFPRRYDRRPPPPSRRKRRKPPRPMNCCDDVKKILRKVDQLSRTEKATVTTVSCSLNDQGVWAFQRATTQITVPRAMRAAIEFKSERLAQAAELECLGRNGDSGTVSAFVPRVSCVYVQPSQGEPYWEPEVSEFEIQVPADMRDSIIVTAQEVAKGTAELCRQRNNTAPTSADCVAIMPSESYGFVKESILTLRFCRVDQFPRSSSTDSKWDLHIPNPIADLDWCEHFDSFRLTKGSLYARCVWSASNHRSGAYVLNESEGEKLVNFIDSLSVNTPRQKIVEVQSNAGPSSDSVQVRIARAYLVPFQDGQRLPAVCFRPPEDGC